MKIYHLTCPTCQAPLDISSGERMVKCEYCNVTSALEMQGNHATLIKKEFDESIENANQRTQNVIRESNADTQLEIQRVHLQQEIFAKEMQLSNLQSEIRSLERSKKNWTTRKQLKALRVQEQELIHHIKEMKKKELLRQGSRRNGETENFADDSAVPLKNNEPSFTKRNPGCLPGFGTFMVVGVLFVELLPEQEDLMTAVALTAGLCVFLYVEYFWKRNKVANKSDENLSN